MFTLYFVTTSQYYNGYKTWPPSLPPPCPAQSALTPLPLVQIVNLTMTMQLTLSVLEPSHSNVYETTFYFLELLCTKNSPMHYSPKTI